MVIDELTLVAGLTGRWGFPVRWSRNTHHWNRIPHVLDCRVFELPKPVVALLHYLLIDTHTQTVLLATRERTVSLTDRYLDLCPHAKEPASWHNAYLNDMFAYFMYLSSDLRLNDSLLNNLAPEILRTTLNNISQYCFYLDFFQKHQWYHFTMVH